MAGLCELLITVRTGVNVGHFLDVLDQEGVVTVPTIQWSSAQCLWRHSEPVAL